MKVSINNDEFDLKVNEYIRTKQGDGIIQHFDEMYNSIFINDKTKRGLTKVKPDEVIGVGYKDNLIELLDKDLADKEFSKNGETKPMMSLIPQLAIVEVAKVFTYGANKYEEYNFSKGSKTTTYTDAALRHINKYLRNQDIDDESNLYHLAHAASCILMLLDNDLNNTTLENRNKYYDNRRCS